ncbi:hypothetical protein D9M72_450740 [compost metagenome]
MMPEGFDSPRITAALIASRSIARPMASRTFGSASGFLPFTSAYLSSFAPTFRPRKIERFSGPSVTRRRLSALSRPTSCAGRSCTKSTSPDSSAATRVAGDLIGT